MINQLSQEDITEYASSAQTISEPLGTDYSQGVQVGKTIPAKWWNWLFRAATKRIQQAKSDATNMFTELKNTVVDAGLTPDPQDNTQLAQAASVLSVRGVDTYVQEKKKGYFSNWTTENCTGLPVFAGSDIVTIEVIKAIPNSDNKAFYMQLKQHTSSPSEDHYLHFTSTDLVNWHEITAPNGADLQSFDITYFKGRYYFLYSVKDVHDAQLLYSDDAVLWYFSRSFSEYGAVALRVAANIMWMISASSQTYSNVNYYSYYTADGSSWTNGGTVFRNTANTVDKISDVVAFQGSYIIGNKLTTDGITWASIVTDWVNSAYANVVLTAGNVAILQFNDTEEAWYTLASPIASPVKKLGTWVFEYMGPENNILAYDSSDDYAGVTLDGVNFTKFTITYPTDPLAEFFKCGSYYILGNYKSLDMTTWEAITLPLGATILQYSGIGYYIIAGTYFSSDFGVSWTQGMASGQAFCAVPDYISDTATCMAMTVRSNVVLRCMTFNGVNRVIGTTLYLK